MIVHHQITATVVLSLVLYSTLSNAQPGDRGRHQGPPAEAFEACSQLSEGEACGFTGRHGEVAGNCIVPPRMRDETRLVCAPEGGPPRHHGRERPRT